jgi:hypothetical protein
MSLFKKLDLEELKETTELIEEAVVLPLSLTEKEYRDNPAVSNSDLNYYRKFGLDAYRLYKEKGIGKIQETEPMKLGTLIHCLILEPDKFNERYYVFDGETPTTQQMKNFCKLLSEDEDISVAYEKCYSVKSLSKKEVRERAKEKEDKLLPYIKSLKLSKDKVIINTEDLAKATEIVRKYEKANFIKTIAETCGLDKDSLELHSETMIFAKLLEIDIKGKIDLIINDKDGNYVIVDLKTSVNPFYDEFIKSIENYKYDRELAYYRSLLENENRKSNNLNLNKLTNYKGCFIVAVSTLPPYGNNLYKFQEGVNSKLHTAHNNIIDDLFSLKYNMESLETIGGFIEV